MSNPTTTVLRVVAISSAIGLCLASAGFGAVYAYRIGIQHNALLGVLMVLMAVGLEGVKPLAVHTALQSITSLQFIRGSVLLALGLVAVAYSLTSELSLMSMSRGDLAATRQHKVEQQQITRHRYRRMKGELDGLGASRPIAEIIADILGIETLPGIMIDGVPCGGTYDGRVTRTHCPRLMALRGELARAHRREQLQGKIDGLAAKDEGGSRSVQTADPGSLALATYLSVLGIRVSSELVGQWLNLIPVIALEFGSAFAVVLVHSLGSVPRNISGSGKVVQKLGSQELAPFRSSQLTSRKNIEARLLSHLKNLNGSWKGSERQLAEILETSKPTVRRAILALSERGSLKVKSSKFGTHLSLF